MEKTESSSGASSFGRLEISSVIPVDLCGFESFQRQQKEGVGVVWAVVWLAKHGYPVVTCSCEKPSKLIFRRRELKQMGSLRSFSGLPRRLRGATSNSRMHREKGKGSLCLRENGGSLSPAASYKS